MYKDFRLGAKYNSPFWQYAHRFNKQLNGFDEENFVWLDINNSVYAHLAYRERSYYDTFSIVKTGVRMAVG